jgi:hypothetical protein
LLNLKSWIKLNSKILNNKNGSYSKSIGVKAADKDLNH